MLGRAPRFARAMCNYDRCGGFPLITLTAEPSNPQIAPLPCGKDHRARNIRAYRETFQDAAACFQG